MTKIELVEFRDKCSYSAVFLGHIILSQKSAYHWSRIFLNPFET